MKDTIKTRYYVECHSNSWYNPTKVSEKLKTAADMYSYTHVPYECRQFNFFNNVNRQSD